MPSLVEGFGQVYLEALGHGCPVLGTANTCLPDIGTEADGVFLCEPGDIDSLVGKLEQLASVVPGNRALRAAAHSRAMAFTWAEFRRKLRRTLE
jgi:glycosyltransferase involved in cell wall biosynthesis